jgi:hypothetical protein
MAEPPPPPEPPGCAPGVEALPSGVLQLAFSLLSSPRDLALAGATCASWRELALGGAGPLWRGHYAQRWAPPGLGGAGGAGEDGQPLGWHRLYAQKLAQTASLSGAPGAPLGPSPPPLTRPPLRACPCARRLDPCP